MSGYNGSIHHFDSRRIDESARNGSASADSEQGRDPGQRRVANLLGSGLTDSDYTSLEGRWIDRSLADRAQLRRVDALTGRELIGRKTGDYAGILIPYFHPESDQIREYRLRRDEPDLEYDSTGNLKAKQKYLSPPGRSHMLYLPPGIGPSLLRDQTLPVVITESEFKTRWPSGVSPILGLLVSPNFCRSESLVSTTGAIRSAKRLGLMAAAWT